MRRGQVGVAVACVGALLLVGAATSVRWYSARVPGIAEAHVGLISAQVCLFDECRSLDVSTLFGRHGLLYRVFAWLTFLGALLTALLTLVGTALHLTQSEDRPLKWSIRLAALSAAGALLTFFTMPGAGVEPGMGFGLALLGAACIVGGAIAALLPSSGYTDAPVRPIIVVTPTPSTTAAPASAQPRLAPAASASASTTRLPEADRRRRETELGEGILRHVVKQLEVSDAGVRAVYDGAAPRTLTWAELAAVQALQLPPGTPHGRLVLVDLVPRAGAPLRVTPTTRANYATLPGAGSTSIENFRRLIAHAIAHAPGVSIDADTAAFVTGRAPAAFASIAAFAGYDARWS